MSNNDRLAVWLIAGLAMLYFFMQSLFDGHFVAGLFWVLLIAGIAHIVCFLGECFPAMPKRNPPPNDDLDDTDLPDDLLDIADLQEEICQRIANIEKRLDEHNTTKKPSK